MNKLSKLSVTVLSKNYSQYIEGERFYVYTVRHGNKFCMEALISEYIDVELNSTIMLIGFLRTDYGYKRELLFRFHAVNVEPYEGKETNEIALTGKVNKLTNIMTLPSGSVVRQVVLKDFYKGHTNIVKLNLVDKAARRSASLTVDSEITACGKLNYRKALEVKISDYEEVS